MTPSNEFNEYCWTVIKVAAKLCNLPPLSCLNGRKNSQDAKVRCVALAYIRNTTKTSTTMMALAFGVHHTSIVSAVGKVKQHYAELYANVDSIMLALHVQVPAPFVKPPMQRLRDIKHRNAVTGKAQNTRHYCPHCNSPKVFHDAESGNPDQYFCAQCDRDWIIGKTGRPSKENPEWQSTEQP